MFERVWRGQTKNQIQLLIFVANCSLGEGVVGSTFLILYVPEQGVVKVSGHVGVAVWVA